MEKPIIFAVDDDQSVLRAVARDLRNEYGKDYRVLSTTDANEALSTLSELKKKNETVALFISDQRMPQMLGVEFLEKTKPFFPDAKKILLTAYSDTDAAIKAINEVQLDYYLMKPWDPPEEKLFPVLNDQLDEWISSYVPEFRGINVIGYQWSPKSHTIKDFLSGNLVPYRWLDVETNDKGKELVDLHKIEVKSLPAVIFEDGSFLVDPSPTNVGEKIGMRSKASKAIYDVVIVGAGPAGLAAGVYGGSGGLNTILIERRAPGGQAGSSSRIENYLGFPKGLSGAELSRRAISQATRFGIEFLSPQQVIDIALKDNYKIITLSDNSQINTKCVVITTGVDYRKIDAENIEKFTGAGVYYGAATTEAFACSDKDVYIVGGGNSAGQSAMYLSNFAKNVFIVIRKNDLSQSMSQYLIDQISGTPNINLLPCTVVKKVMGDERLQKIVLENINNGEQHTVDAEALFIFIGAKPVTDWIKLNIIRNEKGFIETGSNLYRYDEFEKIWKQDRQPFLLETSLPGIFAAGDVRAGAMNRVASAVGEGAMAIKFVHEYLASV